MKKSTLWIIGGVLFGVGGYAAEALQLPQYFRWGSFILFLVCGYFYLGAKEAEKAAALWEDGDQNG